MVRTRKKTKKDSVDELISSLSELILLLEEKKEAEQSVSDLKIANHDFQHYQLTSEEFTAALNLLLNSFTENKTLNLLISQQKKNKRRLTSWSKDDETFLLASQVMGLAQRLSQKK